MPRKSADREVRESRAEIAESIPRKPARTLRVRIAEIGPHHLEAFDLASAKDSAFSARVRGAMDLADARDSVAAELEAAEKVVSDLKERHGSLADRALLASVALKALDAKAALVARLHDDTPEAPDIDAGPTA